MRKCHLARFVVSSITALQLVGCSSSDTAPSPVTDSGPTVDSAATVDSTASDAGVDTNASDGNVIDLDGGSGLPPGEVGYVDAF